MQPFWDYHHMVDLYHNPDYDTTYRSFATLNTRYTLSLLRSLLIAPIFEELFFRKFLFGKLLEQKGFYPALLVSSLCFAAIHFETPSNLIPSFGFGIISALIYFKTKNVGHTIVLHFLGNLIGTLHNLYGEAYFKWLDGFNFGFMYWAVCVFGILMTVLGTRNVWALYDDKAVNN